MQNILNIKEYDLHWVYQLLKTIRSWIIFLWSLIVVYLNKKKEVTAPLTEA